MSDIVTRLHEASADLQITRDAWRDIGGDAVMPTLSAQQDATISLLREAAAALTSDAVLPPLPETWEASPFHDITAGDMVRFRIKGTTFGIDVYDDSVEVADFTGVFDDPAAWSIVLRHAQAAQQRLAGGGQ